MVVEQVYLSDSLTYWLSEYTITPNLINDVSKLITDNTTDVYQVSTDNITPSLFDLNLLALKWCKEIYGQNNLSYVTSSWINVVRSKKPLQKIWNDDITPIWHTHTELEKKAGRDIPTFTYVFYLQMPDKLTGTDGMLYMQDSNKINFKILPKIGQCIILPADIPHAPINAPNSKKDRIVFAGNIKIDYIKDYSSTI